MLPCGVGGGFHRGVMLLLGLAVRRCLVERLEERDPSVMLRRLELVPHLHVRGGAGPEVIVEAAGEIGDLERVPPAASSRRAG